MGSEREQGAVNVLRKLSGGADEPCGILGQGDVPRSVRSRGRVRRGALDLEEPGRRGLPGEPCSRVVDRL